MNERSKTTHQNDQVAEKQENPLVSLLLNIVIPASILYYFTKPEYLGPTNGFIVALAFPFLYGVYDFFDRKKFNFISLLGVINVFLTGGIGLLKLDNHWLAVKEAMVPAIIGIVVIGSLKTPFPLVKKMIYNDKIIDVDKVDAALTEKGNNKLFEKLLVRSTYLLASSFFLSSLLNYVLAKVIVVSAPGTVAFNEELGKMTALSYPVIVIPSLILMMIALWVLIGGIKKLTNLDLEDIFKGAKEQKSK